MSFARRCPSTIGAVAIGRDVALSFGDGVVASLVLNHPNYKEVVYAPDGSVYGPWATWVEGGVEVRQGSRVSQPRDLEGCMCGLIAPVSQCAEGDADEVEGLEMRLELVRQMTGIEKKTAPELQILANKLLEVSLAIERENPHPPAVKHSAHWLQSMIMKDQEIAFFEASTAAAVMYHCHVSELAVDGNGKVLVNQVDKILYRFDKSWVTDTGSDDED
eukprot:g66623.t1